MPPVTKAGQQAFRKDVAFVAKDDDEQIAAGIVMVPDKADLQNDFAREDTIRSFADQFETFADAGEAGGGIMHAVWPDGWMSLERNEVLDEAEEIGGETVEAGAWVQEWAINEADLWELIQDDILSGYSIGAIQVDWNGPFEQDELDDVAVPEELGEDELVWELIDGIIREVSAVDIPAVPDAQILDTKAEMDKRLADHLGNQDAFVEEALERGHTEAEAERLWDVLTEATEADGAAQPGKQSMLARAGKAFLSALSGSDPESDDGHDATRSPEASDRAVSVAETPGVDPREKEGRTLSKQNQKALFATVDASLDVLQDAGVEDLPKRFTDRDDVDFDLTEHDAREWGGDHGDEDDEDGDDGDDSPTNNAAGGDTPDDTTDMSNTDDDGGDDDKSLAERNAEQISELTDAVTDLTEAVTGPEPKTAEIEIGGDTYELPEEQVKAALGVDGDTDVADAIAQLKSEVDETKRRVDQINQQSGRSQQLEAGADDDEDDDGLDSLGKALS